MSLLRRSSSETSAGRSLPVGGYLQHKFYLGRDENPARLANMRLEKLWDEVSQRWQRENQFELEPTDRPVWDPVTLSIAEAIRQGSPVAKVALPVPFSALIPESPLIGQWLDTLQKDITVIKVELRNPQAQEKSEEFQQWQGRRLLGMGREDAPPKDFLNALCIQLVQGAIGKVPFEKGDLPLLH